MSWPATYITVAGAQSDLYDAPYAPRETILTLTVTSGNITARLLYRADDGSYVPLSGATIHIYELVNQSWSPVGDFVTDSNGVVSIDRPNTAEWYKAVYDGTDEYQPAVAYAQIQPQQQPPTQQQQPGQVSTVTACGTISLLWLLILVLLLGRGSEE